ncbi:Dabb family protein [Tannerella sp.]|uniref:Dabb family protein n=1 Tax=Tannerella sp. TaxID=2382127 RepID=UPI0026DC0DE6|nr:Dabb family protein [Tannerella sp.]MDO4704367.1 Dabb family protein [Tannerella sp.]
MKRRNFIRRTGHITVAAVAGGVVAGCSDAPSKDSSLQTGEILHTVIFDLKHPASSPEAKKFLEDGTRILTAIPGVRNFQALRQCSPKNDYTYGFLMKFDSQAEFDAYTAHPDHCRFVKERWETEVTRFQESDFITP